MPVVGKLLSNKTVLALKHRNIQPLLIPLSQDSSLEDARRVTVHLAISDPETESNALSLLGRNARFSVVKGSIGYAAEADVRIIDRRPDPDQVRALDELKSPRLLFLGETSADEELIEAARAGAWAFVALTDDIATLEAAILTLAESAGSPLLLQLAAGNTGAEAVLNQLSAPAIDHTENIPESGPLTTREIEILELIAHGEPSKGIGKIVGLGEQTIKNYVLKILDKTHTRNRAHAAAVAAQRGWFSTIEEV